MGEHIFRGDIAPSSRSAKGGEWLERNYGFPSETCMQHKFSVGADTGPRPVIHARLGFASALGGIEHRMMMGNGCEIIGYGYYGIDHVRVREIYIT